MICHQKSSLLNLKKKIRLATKRRTFSNAHLKHFQSMIVAEKNVIESRKVANIVSSMANDFFSVLLPLVTLW